MRPAILAVALLMGVTATSYAQESHACEELRRIDQESAQKLMDVLTDAGARPMDQTFAFETLSCASQPAIRRFALEQGLGSKQAMLRSQALMAILFQRESIRIDIIQGSSGVSADDKSFLAAIGGAMTVSFISKNKEAGCISLSAGRNCAGTPGHYVRIDGTSVRMRVNQSDAVGEFTLQADGSLRGAMRPWGRGTGIPAKIDLL